MTSRAEDYHRELGLLIEAAEDLARRMDADVPRYGRGSEAADMSMRIAQYAGVVASEIYLWQDVALRMDALARPLRVAK